jgi:hypothetical protein
MGEVIGDDPYHASACTARAAAFIERARRMLVNARARAAALGG